MRAPDSVRDHVLTLLLAMVLLVSLVAGAGAVGVTSLTEDVDALVGELRPAAYSNVALRNDMTQAQAAARGWALTRDPQFQRRHRTAVAEARAELRRLESLVPDESRLGSAVAQQRRAIGAWLSAAPATAGRDPRATRSPAVLRAEQAAFDRFVRRNDAVSFVINAEIDERGDRARDRGLLVLVVVSLVSLLGLAVTALVCRSLVSRVGRPLREMELAVERLAAGDLAARVNADGPRETRRVATALNALAEENQRARQMEEQVLGQMRRLDLAKDEFVSAVSHELRTPLTSISGYVELFEDGLDAGITPQQRGMLTVIRRNVARLRTLIEDLLTLSSVEADAFRTTFELCDLNDLTTEVAHDVATTSERAGVAVRVLVPEQTVPVHGDPSQLTRAMLNVVSNAVKFSQPGSEVVIELIERDGSAVFEVRDRGMGIPAEELTTLGTRFFRGSNAVEAEISGTGLGLRIVQTIADNHRGRLELESRQGAGTTARLVLPAATSPDAGNIDRVSGITEE